MSCQRFEEWIALAAGEDLEGDDARRLDEHVRSCEGCAALLDEMRRNRQVLGTLGRVDFDDQVLAGVRAGVLGRIERPAGRLLGFPLPPAPGRTAWLAAVAAILVVVGASWLAVRWARETPVEPDRRVAETRTAEPVTADPRSSSPEVTRPDPPPPREVAAVRPLAARSEDAAAPRPPADPPISVPVPVPNEPTPPDEPVLVKWYVEDPDLVIYWIVETDPDRKESAHEISEV